MTEEDVTHTAPPWEIRDLGLCEDEEDPNHGQHVIEIRGLKDKSQVICTLVGYRPFVQANAKLIVTTPHLLKALEDALAERKGWGPKARQIILEAHGKE